MLEVYQNLGVVVIGRNEGERLKRCLRSVVSSTPHIVYVDSGSSDDSVEFAQSLGVCVVNLDMSQSFTAARARNAGAQKLMTLSSDIKYIQFIDGDCEFFSDWLEQGVSYIEAHEDIVVVCGRVRERHPGNSIYNQLCDWEWNTPIGEMDACGGIAIMRASCFFDVGGFNPALIAGEEPELCIRLRENQWKIWRIDHDMVWHDADMTKFSQWWKRTVRGGHAFAEVSQLHKNSDKAIWLAETRRALLWGGVFPSVIIIGALFHYAIALLALIYPLQYVRLALRNKHNNSIGWMPAWFLIIGKFAETKGIITYYINKLFNKQSTLIEYKLNVQKKT